MKIKNLQFFIVIFLLFFYMSGNAQKISMLFPEFAGKTYDFILFQGSKPVVQKGIIPADGRFVLEIPKGIEPVPYMGMSRWLITNTQEGGGLDMIIPGEDFSVECKVKAPVDKDIRYRSNSQNKVLDSLYKIQKGILDRYAVMSQAVTVFPKADRNYKRYMKALEKQITDYAVFKEKLLARKDYASDFLVLSNIINGVGFSLGGNEKIRDQEITDYITHQMDWDRAYTSGYWNDIVKVWTDLETVDFKEHESEMIKDFTAIGRKLTAFKYSSFVERVTHVLVAAGKDHLIEKLRESVVSSGKISRYDGVLSVYQKSGVGMLAPELLIPVSEKLVKDTSSLSLITDEYKYSLVVFYHTGCGHCDAVIKEMNENFGVMEQKKIRIITISGDSDFSVFKKNTEKFKWKSSYCDLQGTTGINFKNYGVAGTPTLILVDAKGKIISRESALAPVLKKLKS